MCDPLFFCQRALKDTGYKIKMFGSQISEIWREKKRVYSYLASWDWHFRTFCEILSGKRSRTTWISNRREILRLIYTIVLLLWESIWTLKKGCWVTLSPKKSYKKKKRVTIFENLGLWNSRTLWCQEQEVLHVCFFSVHILSNFLSILHS